MREKDQQISLGDLSSEKVNGNSNLKEVDPYELKGHKKVEEDKNVMISDAFGALDKVTERIAKDVDKFHEQKAQYEIEQEINGEVEYEDDDYEEDMIESISITPEPKAKINTPGALIDDEDFGDTDIDEEEEETDESEVQFNMMQNEIKKAISPVNNKIDLNKFTISKKPVSVANALRNSGHTKTIADWALFTKGEVISLSEFSGFEIEKLNPNNGTRNKLNKFTEIYNLIFSHLMNSNKPFTMEEWIKGISFYDLKHLYFAIYRASFDKANYIPYDCPHCKHVFVSKDTPIEDMVKYKDEKVKEEAQKILEKEAVCGSNEYDVDLVQVSDKYVIGIKDPSIYNIIFENIILDEKFVAKYAELLEKVSYIDSIYLIDYNDNSLRPIEIETYPDNLKKTVKNRIGKFAKVLQSLDSDQFNEFEAALTGRDEKNLDIIDYVLPKIECPKCKKEIEERVMNSEDILFTRHQLARIANMSTK